MLSFASYKFTFQTNKFYLFADSISHDIQVSIDEQSLFSRRPRSFIPAFSEILFKEKKLVTEGFALVSNSNPLLFFIHFKHPLYGKIDVRVKITPTYAELESTISQEDLRTIGFTLLKVYE